MIPRVAVLTPAEDHVAVIYLVSLMNVFQDMLKTQAYSVTVITHVRRSNLAASRNHLVQSALDCGATHMLFIDSDMKFPGNTVSRLLACNVDIVGANYPSRAQGNVIRGPQGAVPPGKDTRMGTGLLMVKREVFEHLPMPWFLFAWKDNQIIGEDDYFRYQACAAGYSVHCDFDLSREIGHAGTFVYTNDEEADIASLRSVKM